jgi:tRNA pseudouridine-54 N-methylase
MMNVYVPFSPLQPIFLAGKLVAGLILAAAFCLAAAAQTSVNFGDNGLNFPTPGMQFQAEATMHSTQHLGDGTVIVKELHVALARDDQGRFSFVSHSIRPANNLEAHIILDPVSGRELSWGTLSKAVMSTPIRATSHITVSALPREQDASSTLPADEKQVTKEDLGSKTIAGIPVVGTRTVTTIAAGNIGNSQQIVIRHEQWTSPDLQLIVAESDDNPFGATRTYEITSFERSAPPENLFQAPENIPLQTRTLGPIALPSIGRTPPPPPSDLSSLLAAPDSPPAPGVPPDQQASSAQVTKMLQLMHPHGQMELLMKAMPLPMSTIMRQQFQLQVSLKTQNRPDALTPEQQAALLALRSKYEEKELSLYSTEGMIADMSPIYQRHMTQTDVEAYIALYSSPAGERMVDVQPVIEKELMPVLMRHMLAAQKELTDQMKKDIDACISSNAPAQK